MFRKGMGRKLLSVFQLLDDAIQVTRKKKFQMCRVLPLKPMSREMESFRLEVRVVLKLLTFGSPNIPDVDDNHG